MWVSVFYARNTHVFKKKEENNKERRSKPQIHNNSYNNNNDEQRHPHAWHVRRTSIHQ